MGFSVHCARLFLLLYVFEAVSARGYPPPSFTSRLAHCIFSLFKLRENHDAKNIQVQRRGVKWGREERKEGWHPSRDEIRSGGGANTFTDLLHAHVFMRRPTDRPTACESPP